MNTFRQQLHRDDNPELATLLDFESKKVDQLQYILDHPKVSEVDKKWIKELSAYKFDQIFKTFENVKNDISEIFDFDLEKKLYQILYQKTHFST